MKGCKMWAGGKWVDEESRKTFASINPATGEKIARVPLGDRESATIPTVVRFTYPQVGIRMK